MAKEDPVQDDKNIWNIEKVIPETEDTASIYLKGYDEKFAVRKAGQFASVRIMTPEEWSEPHSFTISNAPEDPFLRLTVKKAGEFTAAILDLKPGSPVICMGPLGTFCKDIDTKPTIAMIAGGVGITPFLSVLLHFRNKGLKNKAALFWVNRTFADTLYGNEIEELTEMLNLRFVHCFSREDNVQQYFKQRYPNLFYEKGHLSGDILKRRGVDKNASFYLCGPPPMMEASLKEVAGFGIDPMTVEQEKFS